MGLYDRDYSREEREKRGRRRGSGSGFSAVVILIILNVGLFLVNQVSSDATSNQTDLNGETTVLSEEPNVGVVFNQMALKGGTTSNPFQWYRCLTYAFAHDPTGFFHLLGNMLVLFFFGPPLETCYGKKEFALFYLISAFFCGVLWNILNFGTSAVALGASGSVTALVILFAFNYPKAQILLWGILPLPAWVAGVLFVLYDTYGAFQLNDNIAHDVHLSGAVFAALYFVLKIRFENVLKGKGRGRTSRRGSVAHSDKSFFSTGAKNEFSFVELEKEVNNILRKIASSGEESLTERERETLRYASREYQKRKNQRRF